MATQAEITRHALAETLRVAREGGSATVSLPDPETGALLEREIGHSEAQELLAWLNDRLTAETVAREQRDEALTGAEREALRFWRENVPHAYKWVVSDGCSILIPENAAGLPLPCEYPLAAHPSEYADEVGWLVPKNTRRGRFQGYIRLGVPTCARWTFVATLRFPPGANLLAAWTVFERLNAERAMERLSPEDRRRHLSVYGTRVRDGQEEAFNRLYKPTHVRPAGDADASQHWFYSDEDSEAEMQRRADAAAAMLGIGKLKN